MARSRAAPLAIGFGFAFGGVFVAAAPTACVFNDQAPDGAVIVCVTNDDCPSGHVCDEGAHECTLPGADVDVAAPALVSVELDPPAAADGVVTLVVTADEPLATDAAGAPVASFDGIDPGFSAATVDGAIARFTADVGALPEGPYPLRSVTLTDVNGNSAVRITPDTTFVVDRRAPVVLGLAVAHAVDAETSTVFSANAGTNQMQITFGIDEAVRDEDITVLVGELSSQAAAAPGEAEVTCTRGTSANNFVCLATVVAEAFSDISDRVVVGAVDAAGNRGEASLTFAVDLSPPVPLTVEIEALRPGSNDVINALLPGGVLEVDIVADEALGAAPELFAQGDITLGVTTNTSTTPLRWQLRAPVNAVGDVGAEIALSLQLVDLVGNAQTLPIGVLSVGGAIVAPCVLVENDGSPTTLPCIDFDADGDFAVTATCPSGLDCDDTSPLARSDALEIPGDGVDNDCRDGDAPIDETTGVFVNGNALISGDGTRAAPLTSITNVDGVLDGRRWVYLAASPDEYATGAQWPHSIIGGFDPVTWTRPSNNVSNSRVELADVSLGDDVIHFENVSLEGGSDDLVAVGARLSLRDARMVSNVTANDRIVAVNTSFDGLVRVFGTASGNVIARSLLRNEIIVGDAVALQLHGVDDDDFVTTSGDSITARVGARVVIVNSRVGNVVCEGCTKVGVFHSIVIAGAGDTTLLRTTGIASASLDIQNSILRFADPSANASVIEGAGVRVIANLFDVSLGENGLNLIDSGTEHETLEGLNGCDQTGGSCADARDNIAGDPGFAFDDLHIEADSLAVNRASTIVDNAAFAAAADIDGACRDNNPDIGVDER